MKELIEIDLGVRDEDIPTAEIVLDGWADFIVEGYGKDLVWVGAIRTHDKFTLGFNGVVLVSEGGSYDDRVMVRGAWERFFLRGKECTTDAMIEEISDLLLLALKDNVGLLAGLARARVAQDRRREVAQARARVEQMEALLKSARETLAAAVDAEQNG